MKGRAIAYSADELAFVEERACMSRRKLHELFVAVFDRHDVTVENLKRLCTRRGWGTRERWTAEDDAVLREKYPDTRTDVLAKLLGRSLSATYGRANSLELVKSEAYLASPDACRLRRGDNTGAATRFQKGQTPANKGKKHPKGWAPGRMRETQFKPGKPSWRLMPIGSERLIDGYRYTKISDAPRVPYTVNWKATHLLRWEALHGPIPEGHCLKSVDGNRQNVEPSNWQLISRSLLPRLNGGPSKRLRYDAAPDELKPTLMAVAKLEHLAKRRRRQVTA